MWRATSARLVVAATGACLWQPPSTVFAKETTIPALSLNEFHTRYDLLKELGKGGYARVMLALDRRTGKEVAVKIFDPKCATAHEIQQEVNILERLGPHPHIVNFEGLYALPSRLILLMECVKGGELFDFIVSQVR